MPLSRHSCPLVSQESPELRLNLGERFLSSIFAPWAADAPPPAEPLPSFTIGSPAHVGISLSEGGATLLRCRADALPNEPPEETPAWIVQCVVHGQYTPRDSLKLSFLLVPQDGSRLPQLPAGANRLSAPRALKASRVALHVERSLRQAGVNVGGDGESSESSYITLHCGDKALPAGMSLLTARQFLWKQGGDMVLSFSLDQERA